MKKLRGITKALIWVLFTVPVAAGGTIYYFEAVASGAQADVIALLLWISVMLLVTAFTALLCRWTEQKPGILCLGAGASAALEIICCIILAGAGIYFRIGQEFVTFWSEQDGNPVVEAALVTLNRTVDGQTDLVTSAYVYLLNQLFLLVGNLSLAAAGMQLMLFIVGGVLLYFLVRRCYGAFPAVICLGGLMLLPEMIRASMYCSPEILLFLLAVILGWILHLCLDGRLNRLSRALLDLLVLALFTAGCVYVDRPQWDGLSGEILFDRVLAASGQTALVVGILCAVIFLFLESFQTVAVYMLMAVLLMAVQMLGLVGHVGCMAALGIVMSTLLGISLQGLLFGEPSEEEEQAAETVEESMPESPVVSAQTAMKQEEKTESELAGDDGKSDGQTLVKTEMTLAEESAAAEMVEKNIPEAAEKPSKAEEKNADQVRPEIFIPETMETPKRKKRAKIDFDKEFPEEDLNFDLEVKEDEEFDR
ncbi:MAG: hypothetical protein LUG61_01915 [Lachnospiraceae bacterium]|nr:hypothetical protein [Lachnospiraceae bacterium]